MASLQGTSNLSKQITLGDYADAKLAQQLQLYKPVATIRDMKQSFIYMNINAGITDIHPLRGLVPSFRGDFTNPTINNGVTPISGFPWVWNFQTTQIPPIANGAQLPYFSGNQYFTPIGTERKLDISGLMNELCDIRVPRDKTVIEITLAECQIEADSSNWSRIPDYVFYIKAIGGGANAVPLNSISTQPTYVRSTAYVGKQDGAGTDDAIQILAPSTQQATKLSQPETLFVRIKELCNGEPYNWSVTNSGTYTVDKNQPVVMKYGDMPSAMLTVEFGHLVFPSYDLDATRLLTDEMSKGTQASFITQNDPYIISPNYQPKRADSKRLNDYKYLDYNKEHFNTIVTDPADLPANPLARFRSLPTVRFTNDLYIDQYINSLDTSRIPFNIPSNRPPFILASNITNGGVTPDVYPTGGATQGPTDSEFLAQGLPLKYNQQVRAIVMRWSVKVVSLF